MQQSATQTTPLDFLFGPSPIEAFPSPPVRRKRHARSKASLDFLFDDRPPVSFIPKARHKHPPTAHPPTAHKFGILGRIRPPKAEYDIRQVAVRDRDRLQPPSNDELVARYHGWLMTVAHQFQRANAGSSEEDREDAIQDALLKLIKVSPNQRNHDRFCKVVLTNQLITSFARYRRIFDPLTPIEADWDTITPDEPDTSILSRLTAKDDGLLTDLFSSRFTALALASLSTEHAVVMSFYLGLGEDATPILNLRTLSKRCFVSVARLPAIIRSATAKLKRWHAEHSKSLSHCESNRQDYRVRASGSACN